MTPPGITRSSRESLSSPSEGLTTETADFGYRKVRAEEKANWVLRHFNSIADKYDAMNTLLSFGLHYSWKRRAIQALELKPGDRVIDVCGGTADLSILAAGAVGHRGQIILYDINRAMMAAGKPKVTASNWGERIRYVQGDAEAISFLAGKFEAAIVGFGIRNLTHMEKGFLEMYRVLKPGGKFMCLEFSRPLPPFFRWLYDQYSFRVMPWAGKILAGTREAYTYLPESIRLFPLPEELSAILKRIGFSRISFRRFTQGIAVVHTGVKPE
jgi:demethylmenaquinone methyltransferase / 2-methoxy-6-polyprenyl-1,4-benzoquinol methylase